MAESTGQKPDTALLIIDIQNDYFPGGAMELEGAEAAGEKAGAAIRAFRSRGLPVIHVRHLSVRPGSTFFIPGTRGRRSTLRSSPAKERPWWRRTFPTASAIPA
jgi:nicotinamidase-related amidase